VDQDAARGTGAEAVRPNITEIRARWLAIDELNPNDFYSPSEMGAARRRMMADARADVPALCDRVEALEAALRRIERHVGNDAEFDDVWDASGAQAALEGVEP